MAITKKSKPINARNFDTVMSFFLLIKNDNNSFKK